MGSTKARTGSSRDACVLSLHTPGGLTHPGIHAECALQSSRVAQWLCGALGESWSRGADRNNVLRGGEDQALWEPGRNR